MELLTHPEIGPWFQDNLPQADQVSVAVAYFNPEQRTLDILRDIPDLEVIVSDEFQINNPLKLRELAGRATVTCVSATGNRGRLHAKLVVCKSPGGRRQAILGSANFTYPGLYRNNELCISLDSLVDADRDMLDGLEAWLGTLRRVAVEPDWDAAARKWNSRPIRRNARPDTDSVSYWLLKTTEGGSGVDHWEEFKGQQVVAIGWPGPDPTQLTEHDLVGHYTRTLYPDSIARAQHAAKTVHLFTHQWAPGDLAIICRGWPANSRKDVFLYGFGRVRSGFIFDSASEWRWQYKRSARIQTVDCLVPKRLFVDSLRLGSALQTIHSIEPDRFHEFKSAVETETGEVIDL